MADIVIGFVSQIAMPVVNLVWHQIDYAWNYRKHIETMKNDVEETLMEEKTNMNHTVKEAERKGKKVEESVGKWQDRADMLSKEADMLIAKAQVFLRSEDGADKKCFVGWFSPNCITRHQQGRKATKMSQKVAQLVEEKRKKIDSRSISYHEGPKGIVTVKDYVEFKSRKSIFDDIMQALRDPDVTKIGVYGINGVGKTTLVRAIAARAMEEKLIEEVAMATVFQDQNMRGMEGKVIVEQTPDLRRIQGEIKDGLDFEFRKETESGRADELRERLMDKKKKRLVILDNIRVGLKLEDVGIPFDHEGCKILMTSTNDNVLREQMGSKNNFLLDLLWYGEAEEWFKKMMGDIVKDPSFEKLAGDVADKCARLPILVFTVANVLKHKKDLSAWEDVSKKLSRYDKDEMHQHVDLALQFSFRFLRGNETKLLFLLCGQFRPTTISINSLLRYSRGLGLFKDCITIADTRKRLLALLDELKASSLLLEGYNYESVRMHDIVHNFAVLVPYQNKKVFTVASGNELLQWPAKSGFERYTAISLPYCSKIPDLPEELECSNVKSFLLFCKDPLGKIPDHFFKRMKKLRVLDLKNIHFSESLPSSLQFLINLRTLCLDQCKLISIKNIAIIGKLKNLEILSFRGSDIVELPMEIAHLSCLRVLDLSSCQGLERIPPNVLKFLEQLEDLHMENICLSWVIGGGKGNLAELELLSNLNTLDIHIADPMMLPSELFSKKLERFKILIGDGWDWPYEYKTPKTLKLKLNADVLSKKGVQVLLMEAEDIQLKGVLNSLYELDGQGFPLLKHLHIEESHDIEFIINSTRSGSFAAFTRLESLCLDNLKNLKKICDGKFMSHSFVNLRKLEVRSCDELNNLFSSSMVRELPHLEGISIINCKLMEEIVIEESDDDAGKDEGIKLPQLLTLKLESLPQFRSFFSPSKSHARQNLSEIKIDVKVKEIVSEVEQETRMALFSKKVAFPNLVYLEITKMDKLKVIWQNELHEDSFCKLRWLEISQAEELQCVFPSSNLLSRFRDLSSLYVKRCDSLTEVFRGRGITTEGEMHGVTATKLRTLSLKHLPNLRHIWNENILGYPSFPNLESLRALECQNLKSVFPASIAKGLVQLQSLDLNACGVEEIISMEKGMEAGDKFVFPQLTNLKLQNLPQLERFYQEKHSVEWLALKYLEVGDCDKIEIFASELQRSQGLSSDDLLETRPLFTFEKVIANLEELPLNSKDATMILNGQFSASHFPKVKFLHLQYFNDVSTGFPFDLIKRFDHLEKLAVRQSCFTEIFSHVGPTNKKHEGGTLPQIKYLKLDSLCDLKHIQLDLLIENLETFKVWNCCSLISLGPYSASFRNLKILRVQNCERLVSLVTLSTVEGLVQLTELSIKECKMITEIVMDDKNEMKGESVIFCKLETLTLECLTSLTSFCSVNCTLKFPSLEDVTVSQCPKMSVFSKGELNAPKLRGVYTGQAYKKLSHLDLNSTIGVLYAELAGFNGLKHVKLSEFPELKGRWPDQLPVSFFVNTSSLTVDECGSCWNAAPSNLLPSLDTLEELEVRNCDSVEEVFDPEQPNADDEARYLSKLNKFHLINLARLRHVWNENLRGILDFRNLKLLRIHDCGSLQSVFSPTMILNLVKLQEIEVKNCPMIQEIITKEASQKITFPCLVSITLESLPQLGSFYSGSGIVECLLVKKITVVACPSTFTSSFLRGQEPGAPDDTTKLKVGFPNLENLRVEWSDTIEELWTGQFQAEFFDKLKAFELINFPDHYVTFPSHFLQRLPSLENLAVSNACFQHIVLHTETNDEGNCCGVLTKLRELKLCKLPKLMLLSKEDSESCLVFENLETLEVWECCRLEILVPPSVSFWNLETLEVSKCHGLINLLTSSTAKSLSRLRRMSLTECEKIEEIIKYEENVAGNEVVFEKLVCLRLRCLPSLKGFYSGKWELMFPSLEEVEVRECPKMEFFSRGVIVMPKLKKLQLTEGAHRGYWEGNLNAPVQHLFAEMGQAAAQSMPCSPRQPNMADSSQEAENMTLVTDKKSLEDLDATQNPDKVETSIKVATDETREFVTSSSDRDNVTENQNAPANIHNAAHISQQDTQATDKNETMHASSVKQSDTSLLSHSTAVKQAPQSFAPVSEVRSFQITEGISHSHMSFESLFSRAEELLEAGPESSYKSASNSALHAEYHVSDNVNSESYDSSMDFIRKILKRNLAEVATSTEVFLLSTNLMNLMNNPHLNTDQLDIIQEYIENFESLVTCYPNYERQIGMTSAVKSCIEVKKNGIVELKASYKEFTSKANTLSAEKEALKKRLHEIEEEEERMPAEKEAIYANLVATTGELETNVNALPEADRQWKMAEDTADKANRSWAKLRILFP